jgi:hypothetical protein
VRVPENRAVTKPRLRTSFRKAICQTGIIRRRQVT